MINNKLRKPVLMLLLAFAMVVTACSGGNNNNSNNAPTAAPAATNAPAESAAPAGDSSLPIVQDKMSLKTWVVTDGNFRGENYNEKVSFQKMEELTNINIDWVQGSGASGVEAFNLLMASGQLPDIVAYNAMNVEGPKYGQQGAFVELSEYIDQYAPNFKRILEENPEVKRLISTADGKIYHFPQLNLNEYTLVQMYPQVRADWLEKLGLQEPKTTDDWYNMLLAFKTQDPNGNGQADEIPFVSTNLQTMVKTFAPAFGVDWEFYIDNGQVKYAPVEQGFKDTLQWMGKLYAEGLIDPNYLVDAEFKFLTEKVTTNRAGAWAGWAGSYMRSFTDLMKDDPSFKLMGTEPPVGPNGDQRYGYHAWPVGSVGAAVSTQSKNIVEAVKWLDFQYSEEGILLNNFGVEGVSYDMVDGFPKYKDVVFNNPAGLNSTESLLSFTIGGGSWPGVQDERYLEQYDIQIAAEAKAKVGKYIDFDKAMPPVTLTTEQNDKVVTLLADIRTFVDEYANAYVMGNRTFDKYDAEFVEQLKKMKIEEVIAVYQEAYESYLNR